MLILEQLCLCYNMFNDIRTWKKRWKSGMTLMMCWPRRFENAKIGWQLCACEY